MAIPKGTIMRKPGSTETFVLMKTHREFYEGTDEKHYLKSEGWYPTVIKNESKVVSRILNRYDDKSQPHTKAIPPTIFPSKNIVAEQVDVKAAKFFMWWA